MTISRLQESLFRLSVVRLAVALVFFCRGGLFLAAGRLYRGLLDLSWIVRVSNVAPIRRLAYALIAGKLAEIRKSDRNALVESYRADPASSASAARYSLTGAGPRDLFRDVIVLKRFRPGEKGVLLLKYAQTFDAVFSMFDIARLTERYVFVLEPCWAGYCDPSILMFVAPGDPVIVQCFTEQDFRFIEGLGAPFVPVRLGPADWVDADLFKPTPAPKTHDLVMVANWAPHKRHGQLFRALEQIRNRDVSVLLIGFPWAGRTADDIRREASVIRNARIQIEIREQLPPAEVARSVGAEQGPRLPLSQGGRQQGARRGNVRGRARDCVRRELSAGRRADSTRPPACWRPTTSCRRESARCWTATTASHRVPGRSRTRAARSPRRS